MSLTTQSTAALMRRAEQVIAQRSSPQAVPPAVLWQRPGEDASAFETRVLRGHELIVPQRHLLAVCGPEEHPPRRGLVWVHLPPKLLALLNPKRPARYRVAHGGRGGAKSWGFARGLIARAVERPTRVLCARELQGSIRESVHRLLSDQIEQLGLLPWFEIQQATILGPNGSEFIFEGVRTNPTKIKSMEGIDIAWLEEGEKVSEYSWSVLIPTVRKPGSEIWCSFNPDQEDDPTYVRFVKKPPDSALVERICWLDNPWFPVELERDRAYLERVDPDAHAWIWRGECRAATDAQVFHGKHVVEEFEPTVQTSATQAPGAPKPWSGPYQGADWGFSQDPTVLVKCWIHERTLYIEHEAYGVGVDIDKTPALFDRVPGARNVTIRADNARPETISYMQQNGYWRTQAVEKWKGSVEDGIAHIRQYERVVIHPRCVHTIEEFRLYSYKVDRLSGDVLPDVVDAHNHTIDALRYALQPMIKTGQSGWLRLMEQQVAEMNARKAAEAEARNGAPPPITGPRTVYGSEPMPSIPPIYDRNGRLVR